MFSQWLSTIAGSIPATTPSSDISFSFANDIVDSVSESVPSYDRFSPSAHEIASGDQVISPSSDVSFSSSLYGIISAAGEVPITLLQAMF